MTIAHLASVLASIAVIAFFAWVVYVTFRDAP